ncbi:MAG: ABC transporter substrate-binding protein [Cytophagales bacterium]|nr:ABC transporter substrate-binding protein [Cytophagales bacterium]
MNILHFCCFNFLSRASLSGIIALVLSLCACRIDKKGPESENDLRWKDPEKNSPVKHAIGFDLISFENYKILHLFRHYNELADTISYVLYRAGAEIHRDFTDLKKVEVPIRNVALLHSSYLSFFEMCGATTSLKAISEGKYIYNQDIYDRIKAGELPEVGFGETLDKERLLELDVSAVITVGWPNAPNKSQQLLEELGIPVFILSDWQENTLLGRTEWVKVIAALTGAEYMVAVKFDAIERSYDSLKNLVPSKDPPPKIICNLPYKGSWYLPGGNSYMSNVLRDAGAEYLWSDDTGTGGIQVDFEAVYAKGLKADFWVNPGFVDSRKKILESDKRLVDFQPFITDKIFNCNGRIARGAANDYWESGIVNPHLILADLIKIFHPATLPGHKLYYYRKIN